MKWDMGWMHDTLAYFQEDPIGRRYHHHKLTFRSMYFWSENYVLPLSHDEVVHGKRSLIEKMPGDNWQRFANLRLMYAYMWAQPGKKLLFQGGEIGQFSEWAHDRSVDWHLLGDSPFHIQLMTLRRRAEPPVHVDAARCTSTTSGWRASSGSTPTTTRTASSRSCARATGRSDDVVLCLFNCTPVPRQDYRVGVPTGGRWRELMNSDAAVFGGSGMGNLGSVVADDVACHGRPASLRLTLPPLSARVPAARPVARSLDPPRVVSRQARWKRAKRSGMTRSSTRAARAARTTASCGRGSETIRPAGAARRRCSRGGR